MWIRTTCSIDIKTTSTTFLGHCCSQYLAIRDTLFKIAWARNNCVVRKTRTSFSQYIISFGDELGWSSCTWVLVVKSLTNAMSISLWSFDLMLSKTSSFMLRMLFDNTMTCLSPKARHSIAKAISRKRKFLGVHWSSVVASSSCSRLNSLFVLRDQI